MKGSATRGGEVRRGSQWGGVVTIDPEVSRDRHRPGTVLVTPWEPDGFGGKGDRRVHLGQAGDECLQIMGLDQSTASRGGTPRVAVTRASSKTVFDTGLKTRIGGAASLTSW